MDVSTVVICVAIWIIAMFWLAHFMDSFLIIDDDQDDEDEYYMNMKRTDKEE